VDDVIAVVEAVAVASGCRRSGAFRFLAGFEKENIVGTASGLTSFRDH